MSLITQKLWQQILDLSFDVYCVVNTTTNDLQRRSLNPLKSKVDDMLQCANQTVRQFRTPGFGHGQQLRNFLIEFRGELMLAKGLGLLNQKTFEFLDHRTGILFQNLCHPKVRDLLDRDVDFSMAS